jgi:hypothetical protein
LAQLYKRPVVYFTGESQSDTGMPEDVAHLARGCRPLGRRPQGIKPLRRISSLPRGKRGVIEWLMRRAGRRRVRR